MTLASAPHHYTIVIDRSQPSNHCQMTLERWLPISDEPSIEDAVKTIHAILAASAAPIHQESPIRRRHLQPQVFALDRVLPERACDTSA